MERKVYPPMSPLSRSELREGWREGGRERERRRDKMKRNCTYSTFVPVRVELVSGHNEEQY